MENRNKRIGKLANKDGDQDGVQNKQEFKAFM
jgi:hypothetical protein